MIGGRLRILGVDPGSLVTGWGLVEGSAHQPRVHSSGVIRLGGRRAFADRLADLRRELAEVVDAHAPTAAAVEAPFHGKSSRSALQLAHARGVILAVLAEAGLEVAEYSPATVKKSVTGSGRADKQQVRQMTFRLLRSSDRGEPNDLTDALAVALCHVTTVRFRTVVDASLQSLGEGGPVRGRR